MSYHEDKLKNEKNEPVEGSSKEFLDVPIILLSLFIGFGATYLALETPNMSMEEGDSRTVTKSNEDIEVKKVPVAASSFDELFKKGEKLYQANCQACHQASGKGIPGAFPPLEKSEWVTGSKEQLVAIILYGLQGEVTVNNEKYNSSMPGQMGNLTDEDVAAVSTYIRNSFGNEADLVATEVVQQVKNRFPDRKDQWDGEKELQKIEWQN